MNRKDSKELDAMALNMSVMQDLHIQGETFHVDHNGWTMVSRTPMVEQPTPTLH